MGEHYRIEDKYHHCIGYYDDKYIYNKYDKIIATYENGKITESKYFQVPSVNYRDDEIYEYGTTFNIPKARFKDGVVYNVEMSSKIIGFYQGERGYCAAYLLTENYDGETINENSEISSPQGKNTTKLKSSDSNFSLEGGISELFAEGIGFIFALIIGGAIAYAIFKTAISFWRPNLSGLSISGMIEFARSGHIDADDISLLLVVLGNIITSIAVVIKYENLDEPLSEIILDKYRTIYILSTSVCVIITFLMIPKISTVIGIAFSGLIVSIVPAIITGIICKMKAMIKSGSK